MEPKMSSATLQINVIPKRMLTKSESAHHCGRSMPRFQIECAVRPHRFPNGDLRWDVRELDTWLDSLKAGTDDQDNDTIVALLSKKRGA
jgi:hypothetical protein